MFKKFIQKMFYNLPLEIQRHIWEWDPTWRTVFSNILKEFEWHSDVITISRYNRFNPATGILQSYRDDRLFLECRLKKGVRHGPCQIWFPNGTPCLKSNYQHGFRYGIETEYFYFGGGIKSINTYEKGTIIHALRYFDNGHLFSETHYSEGKKNGLYKSYHRDGTHKETWLYKNNVRIKQI